jgi:competence protein ComGG
MNNQKGMVFPIMMVVAAAFISAALFAIDQYVPDKKFHKETEEKLVNDHLLKLAAKDLSIMLPQDITGKISTGIFFYQNGDVYYQVKKQGLAIVQVTIFATTKSGRRSESIFIFNLSSAKITEWRER